MCLISKPTLGATPTQPVEETGITAHLTPGTSANGRHGGVGAGAVLLVDNPEAGDL